MAKKTTKKVETKEVPKVEVRPEKKVAIVGCSDSKHLAPFDDPSFEIWGVNNLFPHLPEIKGQARWFEIHELTHDGKEHLRRGNNEFRGQRVDDYLKQLGDWAKERNCPIYTQRQWELMPTSTPYPLQEIIAKFGNYFTNTISYEIALAIHEGFTEIHVYGVDMAVGTEYNHQRPSCEYFLGIAVALGIKVHIPQEADLLKTRFLYGFDEPKKTAWDAKCNNIKSNMKNKMGVSGQTIANLQAQIEQEKAKENQYIGAVHAIKELNKVWD
jgi:hypothetical protein